MKSKKERKETFVSLYWRTLLSLALAVATVIMCLLIIVYGINWSVLGRHSITTLIPGITEFQYEQLDLTGGVVLLTSLTVLSLWVYRANRNLHAIGLADLDFSPLWAVMWFWIPFANVVRAPQVVAELWKGSYHNTDGTVPNTWRAMPEPKEVRIWRLFWYAFLFSVWVYVVNYCSIHMPLGTADRVLLFRVVNFLWSIVCFNVGAGVLASAFMMQKIQRMQDAKYASLVPSPGKMLSLPAYRRTDWLVLGIAVTFAFVSAFIWSPHAMDTLSEALFLVDDNTADAYRRHAAVYERLGRKDLAAKCYESAELLYKGAIANAKRTGDKVAINAAALDLASLYDQQMRYEDAFALDTGADSLIHVSPSPPPGMVPPHGTVINVRLLCLLLRQIPGEQAWQEFDWMKNGWATNCFIQDGRQFAILDLRPIYYEFRSNPPLPSPPESRIKPPAQARYKTGAGTYQTVSSETIVVRGVMITGETARACFARMDQATALAKFPRFKQFFPGSAGKHIREQFPNIAVPGTNWSVRDLVPKQYLILDSVDWEEIKNESRLTACR